MLANARLMQLMKSFELKDDKEYTIFEYSSDGEKPEDDATCKVLKFTISVSKTTFRDLGWTVEVVPKWSKWTLSDSQWTFKWSIC